MTDKYKLLMYYVHSQLELNKNKLEYDSKTIVENFREYTVNERFCNRLSNLVLAEFKYELSNNQMCNGINLFLECHKS